MTAGAGGVSTGGGFVVQAESATANRARRVSNRKSRSHDLIEPLPECRLAPRCQPFLRKPFLRLRATCLRKPALRQTFGPHGDEFSRRGPDPGGASPGAW